MQPSRIQPYGFSGKERDDSGLMYFEARYYDPLSTRFISPDPLFAEEVGKCVGSVIECNLYQYTGNNPVMYVDQSGEVGLQIAAMVVGAAISGISSLAKGEDPSVAAQKALGGALIGLAATVPLPGIRAVAGKIAANTYLAGSTSAGVEVYNQTKIEGKYLMDVDYEEVGKQAVVG
ncbi:MAG: RHS repeat-associated core domain-containing protein, partial [Oleispira sp.]|nr:RHS repeat-associated core domain-containing protein [Oleispira sp.]